MSDECPPSEIDNEDPVAAWWETCGHPLQNALHWIERWRHEAREGDRREITYQEFAFRCAGDLVFDGEAYTLAEGLSEVIADMGTPGLLRATSATETEKDLGPVPRLHYELACHIAQTNKHVGRELHRSLAPFASEIAASVKRGKGRSLEDKQLFRTLAWWAVDRGVQLGLAQGKTRERATRRPSNRKKSATELTSECFQKSKIPWGTYDNVNEAWQAHRHQGQKLWMQRVKQHGLVYLRRFSKIDDLVTRLPRLPRP